MPRSKHHLRAQVLLAALVVSALLLASGAGAHAADPGLVRLEVTIGKSQVLELKEPFSRVSVTNPAVADVFVITPSQILINGKAVGTTSLVVFYPRQTLFFDLVVQTDVGLLRERIKQLAPREEIDVYTAQDAVVLSGRVSSEAVVGGITEMAALFAPKGKVVNLLSLSDPKPQQVMLQVHVAEVARIALKELGFNIRALGNVLQGGMWPGQPFSIPLGTLGPVLTGTSAAGQTSPDFLFAGSTFFLSNADRSYAGIVRALAERNMFRTLAKPNLVTQSGKEARFVSGGEFPYPVSTAFNSISVEWKEFGIMLGFTPQVVDGETINLRIRPEVSSLDFANGIVSAGFRVPTIRKNQAGTSISLKDGESFAIAGLVNNEVRQQVSKIPLIGDIPILGALFRSTRFQNLETELLFLVTVKLVKPFVPGAPDVPDATKLMELRPKEQEEFTLVPGFPGVGEVVEHGFGKSNLPGK
jgi:pilus assembly protein CpaC